MEAAIEPGGETRLPTGVTIVLGALAFAALRQGAYHQWQHQVFAVLAAVGALGLIHLTLKSSLARIIGLATVPLLTSTLLSTMVANDRLNALSTFLLIGLIATGALAGAVTPRDHLPTLTTALIGIAVVVAATAIWGVATHSTPWGRVTAGVWRGSSSLTYANAAAAILGPITLLTTTKAAHAGNRLYAVAGVFTGIGFASTQSRGGALVFVVVGLILFIHLGPRRFATTVLPMLLGIVIGLPLLMLRTSVDAEPAPLLIVALLAAGLAATALSWPVRDRLAQPHLLLVAACATIFGVAALTPLGNALSARLSIRGGTRFGGPDADVLLGDRANTWRVAFGEFQESPIFGQGPGELELRWIEEGRSFSTTFVHNEYLELVATHGTVGLVALLASIAVLSRVLRFDATTAPFALAFLAFMAHSAFDFLWHIPMLPVFFATTLGTWLVLSDLSALEPSREFGQQTIEKTYA